MSESEELFPETGEEQATPPSFGEAMEQLEEILAGIEGEEIDIDELGEKLKRAAALLELCRGKIRKAEVEVSQIVRSLEESEAGDGTEPAHREES
jgi:exodeoxyribonuclease VII small subunit